MKLSRDGYKRNSKDVNNPYNVIPSGNITMKGVDFPVMGTDNLGNQQLMQPGFDYEFPGDMVFEEPAQDKSKNVVKQRKVDRDNKLLPNYTKEMGDVSSHLMATMQFTDDDGKPIYIVIPMLHPLIEGQETSDPTSWIEFPKGNEMQAFEFAEQRGEVYYFDSEAKADEFAKGSWKTLKKRDGGSLPKAQWWNLANAYGKAKNALTVIKNKGLYNSPIKNSKYSLINQSSATDILDQNNKFLGLNWKDKWNLSEDLTTQITNKNFRTFKDNNNSLIDFNAPRGNNFGTSIWEDHADFSPLLLNDVTNIGLQNFMDSPYLGVDNPLNIKNFTDGPRGTQANKIIETRNNLVARIKTTEGRKRIRENYLGSGATEADVNKFIASVEQSPILHGTNDWYMRGLSAGNITEGKIPYVRMDPNLPVNYVSNIQRHEDEHLLDYVANLILNPAKFGDPLNLPKWENVGPKTNEAIGGFSIGQYKENPGKLNSIYSKFRQLDGEEMTWVPEVASDINSGALMNKFNKTRGYQSIESWRGKDEEKLTQAIANVKEIEKNLKLAKEDPQNLIDKSTPGVTIETLADDQMLLDAQIEVKVLQEKKAGSQAIGQNMNEVKSYMTDFTTVDKEASAHVAELQQFMLDNNVIDDVYQTITPDMIKGIRDQYATKVNMGQGYEGYPLRILLGTHNTKNNNRIISGLLNKMLTGTAILGTALPWDEKEEVEEKKYGGSLPKAQWKDLFKGVGKIFNKADDFNQVTGLSNIKGGRNLLSNFLKSPNNINSNRVININSLINKFNGVKGKVIDDFEITPVKLFGENSYGWSSPEYIPTNLIKFDNGFQIQTFKSGKRNNNLVGINGPNDDFDVILYSETGNKHNPKNIAYTRNWGFPTNAFDNMKEKGFKWPEHGPFNQFQIKADMEGVDSKKINFGIKAIESLLKNPTLSEKNTISLAGLNHWNNQLNFGYNTVKGGSNTTPFLSYGNTDASIFEGLTYNNKGVKPESPDFIPRVNFNDWDEFTGLQFNTKEDLNTATQRLQEYLTKNKLPFTFKTNNNSIQINVPELKRNWQTGGSLPKAQSQIPKIINTTKSVLTRPFNIHTYTPSTITSIPEIQIGSKAASNFSSNALTNLNHLSEIEHQNLLDDITLNYAKLYQNDVAIQNQLEKFAQFNPDAQITLSHFRNNDVGGMPLTSDDLYFKDIINRNKNIHLADGDGDPFDYGRMNDLNNNFHSYNSAGGLMIQNIPAIRGGTTDMIIGPNTMQHTDPIHNLFKLSKRSGQWEGANQHTFLINTTNRKPSLIVSGDSGFTSFGNDNGWFNKGLIRQIGQNNEDWKGGVDYGSRANFLQKGLNEIGLLDESFKLNTPFKGTYMKFHNVKKYGGEELPKAQVPQLISGNLKLANPVVRNVNIINKTNPWTVFNSNKVLMNINNRADLIKQYNLRNNMYRTVNIDDKVLNNQNLIEGAKSAGFNPKAKDQLAAFMATTFTDGSGRRAGFTNELKRGSNKGILYTGDYPHILNQRYTTGQPYNSWTIKSNLFEDDVTLLSDQEIYNRISLLDTQQSHEPYKGIFNVGSISSNQQLNNLNVPHGSILNTNTILIPELMQTNQIYGELFKPVRTPISLFRGDDLNHLLKINPDRFIQFKNGGSINNLTSRLIKKYEEGGTLTSAGHKHLKSLGMI